MELSLILGQVILYFTYVAALAGALQTSINLIKPVVLTPIKEKYGKEIYVLVIYVFRLLLTIVGFYFVWGGVQTARDVIPLLPTSIPDVGVAFVTIFLVVLGQEVIHPIIERLYLFQKAVNNLGTVNEAPTNVETEQQRVGRELEELLG
jgi:hypothetical protein